MSSPWTFLPVRPLILERKPDVLHVTFKRNQKGTVGRDKTTTRDKTLCFCCGGTVSDVDVCCFFFSVVGKLLSILNYFEFKN